MSSNILRKFNEDISNLIGNFVLIVTSNGNKYKGKLVGITENLNLILENIENNEDKLYKIVLNGNFVSEIGLLSEPFNLKALGERLEKVFPGLVKIHEDSVYADNPTLHVITDRVDGLAICYETRRILLGRWGYGKQVC